MEYQLEHQQIPKQKHSFNLKLMVEDLQSPANYGMMIRMAEALGVNEIIFCSFQFKEITSKMKKSSRSAENQILVRFTENIEKEFEKFRQKNFEIIGLEYTSESKNIQDVTFSSSPKILICGNESTGLSPKTISECDFCIHLPMYGQNSSMNVVMATSLAFWDIIS